MFTGIVQKLGIFKRLYSFQGGFRLEVEVRNNWDDLQVGESIAVNGACLTLVGFDEKSLIFDVSRETIAKTALSHLVSGSLLNLERALRLSDRLGGHLVLGHVDGVGEVAFVRPEGEFFRMGVRVPSDLIRYVAPKGSIAIDGISLTVASLSGVLAEIAVIPHTWRNTNLKEKRVGDKVNIEVDVIARYVESLMGGRKSIWEEMYGLDK